MKTVFKLALFATSFLALSQPVRALDDASNSWVVVSEGEPSLSMKQRDMHNQTNWNPSVWIKGVQTHYVETDESYRHVLYVMDCRAHRYGMKTVVTYDEDGRVLEDKSFPVVMIDVTPDTINDTIQKLACPKAQ